MQFQHAPAIWRDFPALVPGVLYADGITAAVSAGTDRFEAVLIVAEALHDGAAATMPGLTATLAAEISALWPTSPRSAILTAAEPRFTGGRP